MTEKQKCILSTKTHRSRSSPYFTPIRRHSAVSTDTAFPDFIGWTSSWVTTPTRVNFFSGLVYLYTRPSPSRATAVPTAHNTISRFWSKIFTNTSLNSILNFLKIISASEISEVSKTYNTLAIWWCVFIAANEKARCYQVVLKEQSKYNPASQCAYYPPYLP